MTTEALRKYAAKLERRRSLALQDAEALLALPGYHREYRAGDTIIDENARATHCAIVESGFVSRMKAVADGARQIVAFHFPGDAVDLQCLYFKRTDHKIYAHAPTWIYWVPHSAVFHLIDNNKTMAKALWLDTLADAAIFRQWTVNVGHRAARERIAHLFLEIAVRLETIGGKRDDTFELPVTQSGIAEALGLSLVHLNKSLQAIKRDGLVDTTKGRLVIIKDGEKLIRLAGFSPEYLYLTSDRVEDFADTEELQSAENGRSTSDLGGRSEAAVAISPNLRPS